MSPENSIDTLRAEGALADRGEFRLDREKAREKLQKFRLKDPHHYVLEFVQAAHLLGATRIAIAIDADEMEMRFDGEPLGAEQLEGLYDAPFSEDVDRKTRALRHLAIGLSAAQAMEPSVVQIEFTRDGQTTQLEVIDDGEEIREFDAPEEPDSDEPRQARIYLREKFRASHLVDFFRNLRGDLAEKTALRDYCAHSPKEITLDGQRISFGYQLPAETVHQIPIETPHERGVVGLVPSSGQSGVDEVRVVILQNGVRVTEHRVEASWAPARGVIESSRLTKNLSQSAFVADAAWHDFAQTIMAGAIFTLIFDYIDGMPAEQWPSHRAWFRHICAKFSPIADKFDDRSVAMTQRVRRAGNLLEALPKLVDKLYQIPMWPAADTEEHWYAISELQATRDEAVGWVRSRIEDYVDLGHSGPILYFEEQAPEFLEQLLGARLVDLNQRYTHTQERQLNIHLWQHRPAADAPAKIHYPYQQHFETQSMRAMVGLTTDGHRDPEVVFVKEGRLLHRLEAFRLAPRGLAVWFSGELAANEAFDGVEPDDEYLELVAKLVAALPDFVAEHQAVIGDDELKTYLHSFLGGRLHGSLLEELQVPTIKRVKWLRDHLDANPDSPWGVPTRLEEADEQDRASLADIDACLSPLGALVERPLFETATRGKVSIGQLRDAIATHGHINRVSAADNIKAIQYAAADMGIEAPIVCADERDLDLLERLFGGYLRDPRTLLLEDKLSDTLDRLRDRPTRPTPEKAKEEPEVRRQSFESLKEKQSLSSSSSSSTHEDEPEPETELESEVEPSQPEPSSAELLRDRLRAQIARVCRDEPQLLADAARDELRIDTDKDPAGRYALEHIGDEVALAFLSATTYAWHVRSERQSGATDEVRFLRRLISYIDERLA
ncbi:MAG: hypothetical protein ACLFVJ_04315 [Persicimonas sp.]